MPPANILLTELQGLDPGVLSQLPERETIKKNLRRQRWRELPINPRTVEELNDIP